MKEASAEKKEKTSRHQRSSSTKSRDPEPATATSTTAADPETVTAEMQQNIPNQDAPELSRSPQDQFTCTTWSASESQQQVSAMSDISRKGFQPGIEKEPHFDLNQDEIMWDLQNQLPNQSSVYHKPGMWPFLYSSYHLANYLSYSSPRSR